MTSHRRSNLLAKVYGRTRMNAVSQGGKKLARIFLVSATSEPNVDIKDYDAVRRPPKRLKSTGQKDEDIKVGHKPSPPYVLTSKTVTMYNGDIWTRHQYGIGSGPPWSFENWLTTHEGAASSDSLWYCWTEP